MRRRFWILPSAVLVATILSGGALVPSSRTPVVHAASVTLTANGLQTAAVGLGDRVTLVASTYLTLTGSLHLKITDMTRKTANGLNVVIADCTSSPCAKRVYSLRTTTVTFQAWVYDVTKSPGQANRVLGSSSAVTVQWSNVGFRVGMMVTVPPVRGSSASGGGGLPGQIGTIARLPLNRWATIHATTGHALSAQFHLRIAEVVRNTAGTGWRTVGIRADCTGLPCVVGRRFARETQRYYIAALVDMTVPANAAGRVLGRSPVARITWFARAVPPPPPLATWVVDAEFDGRPHSDITLTAASSTSEVAIRVTVLSKGTGTYLLEVAQVSGSRLGGKQCPANATTCVVKVHRFAIDGKVVQFRARLTHSSGVATSRILTITWP